MRTIRGGFHFGQLFYHVKFFPITLIESFLRVGGNEFAMTSLIDEKGRIRVRTTADPMPKKLKGNLLLQGKFVDLMAAYIQRKSEGNSQSQ